MNDLERLRKLQLKHKGYPVRIRTGCGYFIVYWQNGAYVFRHLGNACDWAIRNIEEANLPIKQ